MPIKYPNDLSDHSQGAEKLVVDNAYYYAVLLIDSSQSMLWPYLKDRNNNKHNTDTTDYKEAVAKVQSEISVAHKKALNALRQSSICKGGYLLVYQYTFNNKKKLLHLPEELSAVGRDNVKILEPNNYKPENPTALYNVIHEALIVVEQDYLKKARDKYRRIDKVIIGVVTDGDETEIHGSARKEKITEIREIMKELRDNHHLFGSVLIGLTSETFTLENLKKVRNELIFDEAISINQSDEKAIRKAFKLFSDTANG